MARLCASIVAALVMTTAVQPCRADFDLTGDWYFGIEGLDPVLVTMVQNGTTLETSIQGTSGPVNGTVDPMTGAFSITIPLFNPPLCGAILEAQVDPSGETFTGTASSYSIPEDCPSIECVCTDVVTVGLVGSRSPCGDGVVDVGEDCDDGDLGRAGTCCSLACTLLSAGSDCADDGNVCTAESCDAFGACLHPPGNAGTECRPAAGVCDVAEQCDGASTACPTDAPQPDGTGCSDGLFCNGQETTCAAGVCQTGSPPCPLLCDEGTDQCLADCPTEPLNCRSAEKSLLLVKNGETMTTEKLVWKWSKGEPTSQVEFGDPTDSTEYALCVYAGTAGLMAEAIVPADAAKWSPIGSKGYKFKAVGGTGVTKVLLKGSTENESKVIVKGKGPDLPDLALPAAAPLTVQLLNGTNGLCWGAEYGSAQLLTNDSEQLKAKVP